MPARKKGIRAYLRQRKGREAVWVIRDGETERVIGPGTASREEIERALGAYIGEKYQYDTSERDPANVQVTDVLGYYAENFAIHHAAPQLVGYHMKHLNQFWAGKSLADVKGATCREYLEWRASLGSTTVSKKIETMNGIRGRTIRPRIVKSVKPSTSRRELETLQAAINCWHKESPLDNVPRLTLPPKGVPRQRFLERSEAAALLWACRRLSRRRVPIGRGGYKQEDFSYVARFILVGLYTGTRHDAILRLRWVQSLDRGFVDLEHGVLYRRGSAERETAKRRPAHRLVRRLYAHLSRWQMVDAARGTLSVVHYHGRPIAKMKRAWAAVVKEAGLGKDVVPHVLRHTCATWALWEGQTIWEVAGLLGAKYKTIDETYGHHMVGEDKARKRA